MLEADIKESERELAEVTARFKLAREKSATLKEETEAVSGAARLFTDLAPNIRFSYNNTVESEQDAMVFGEGVSFQNTGKYTVNREVSIDIYREHDGREIREYEWFGSDSFDINPGQQLRSYYKVKMSPDFSSVLTTQKQVFVVQLIYELRTEEDARRFVAKRISSYFSRDSIDKKSQSTATLSFPVVCWIDDPKSKVFSCSK